MSPKVSSRGKHFRLLFDTCETTEMNLPGGGTHCLMPSDQEIGSEVLMYIILDLDLLLGSVLRDQLIFC